MAPLADFLVARNPFPTLPYYLTTFVPGETPLSTLNATVATLASYLAIIFGIQALMKNREAQKLTVLFQAHNIFLSAGSLVLLVLMLEEMIPILWKRGLFSAMCADKSWTTRMEFYYLINYAFKYLELIDTIFLALKKKPLAFLHVYHHSATALLCYSQLDGKTSISWVVISLNLMVHVVMYYYYYATAGGARIWWKKYLTSMQIAQFIIDLGVVYFGTYSHFFSKYQFDFLPVMGDCAGTETAAVFGCVLLSSYLGLFIKFYFQTYKKQVKVKKPTANGNAHANGHVQKMD